MTLALICIALLGLLLVVLGATVTAHRASPRTLDQMPTDPTDRLLIAIRAHGNAAEYVPTLAVLILTVGTLDPQPWMLAAAVVAVASRYVHALGMLTSASLADGGALRRIGAAGTFVAGLALSAATVVLAAR